MKKFKIIISVIVTILLLVKTGSIILATEEPKEAASVAKESIDFFIYGVLISKFRDANN